MVSRRRATTNWILMAAAESNESHLYRKLSTSRYTDIESFDCPVCYSMVLPPIRVVCENLHTVCNRCLPHLSDHKCPKCRLKMDKIYRCFELEHILRFLLTSEKIRKCKYANYGCEFQVKASVEVDISHHEGRCNYQYVKMTRDLDSWYDAVAAGRSISSRMGRLWIPNMYLPDIHTSGREKK